MFERVDSTLKILRIENSFLKWLLRGNIIQFSIILILIITMISLFPLKEKVPYLVQFSNAEMNFVNVKQANSEMTEDEFTRLSLVMAYVLNREVKNNIDDNKRHEVTRLQSSNTVWKQFKTIVNEKDSIYKKEKVTRTIDLLNFHIIPETNIAQIDYKAIITHKGKQKKPSNYRAVIEFLFTEKRIKFNDMPKNPFTFKVVNYNVSKIN